MDHTKRIPDELIVLFFDSLIDLDVDLGTSEPINLAQASPGGPVLRPELYETGLVCRRWNQIARGLARSFVIALDLRHLFTPALEDRTPWGVEEAREVCLEKWKGWLADSQFVKCAIHIYFERTSLPHRNFIKIIARFFEE